ncbi:hypothetical protein O6H91_Y271100 [Diphasiastrum complanatum]|nr:hypothetical protein O6H91_Y271100 [Diphasiastrum complanatum]
MVGLQAAAAIAAGSDLGPSDGLPPLAAALSDSLLLSRCAACFRPLASAAAGSMNYSHGIGSRTLLVSGSEEGIESPLRCEGACQGAVAYCSHICLKSDLNIHHRSGECHLLALIANSHLASSPLQQTAGQLKDHTNIRTKSSEVVAAASVHVQGVEGAFSTSITKPCNGDLDLLPVKVRCCEDSEKVRDGEAYETQDDEAGLGKEDLKSRWAGRTSFSELSGTCDVRAALRLLMYHQDSNNLADFSDISRESTSRIGGLLSNSTTLLKRNNADETECQSNIVIPSGATYPYEGPGTDQAVQNSLGEDSNSLATFSRDEDIELALQVREASMLMLLARELANEYNAKGLDRRDQCSSSFPTKEQCGSRLDEEVLCQVITNGVQVQMDEYSRSRLVNIVTHPDPLEGMQNNRLILGSAVYGPLFSWLNHSCRPNASYRFGYACLSELISEVEFGNIQKSSELACEPLLEIPQDASTMMEPTDFHIGRVKSDQPGATTGLGTLKSMGPCVFVRSILPITVGEEVCVAYIDLLKPKVTRKVELWEKYCFQCECPRCSQVPVSYSDKLLEAVRHCCVHQNSFQDMLPGSIQTWCSYARQQDTAVAVGKVEQLLLDQVESVVSAFSSYEYLRTCCNRLEQLLLNHVCTVSETMLHTTEICCLNDSEDMDEGVCGCNYLCRKCRGDSVTDTLMNYEDSSSRQLNAKCLKLSFMHHACLDGYIVLACAYQLLASKVSASGIQSLELGSGDIVEDTEISPKRLLFSNQRTEQSSLSDRHVHDGDVQNRNVPACAHYTRAAAAYAVLLSSVVQHLFCAGEYGLVFSLVFFWIDAAEALLRWAYVSKKELASLTESRSTIYECDKASNLKLNLRLAGVLEQAADNVLRQNSMGLACPNVGMLSEKEAMEQISNLTFHKTNCNFSNNPFDESLQNMQLSRAYILSLCALEASVQEVWPFLKVHSPLLESILDPIHCKWHEKASKVARTNLEDGAEFLAPASSQYQCISASMKRPCSMPKPTDVSHHKRRRFGYSKCFCSHHFDSSKTVTNSLLNGRVDFLSHTLESTWKSECRKFLEESGKGKPKQAGNFVDEGEIEDSSIFISALSSNQDDRSIILCAYRCLHLTKHLLHVCYGPTHSLVEYVEHLISLISKKFM